MKDKFSLGKSHFVGQPIAMPDTSRRQFEFQRSLKRVGLHIAILQRYVPIMICAQQSNFDFERPLLVPWRRTEGSLTVTDSTQLSCKHRWSSLCRHEAVANSNAEFGKNSRTDSKYSAYSSRFRLKDSAIGARIIA